jgi:hypothetical protein
MSLEPKYPGVGDGQARLFSPRPQAVGTFQRKLFWYLSTLPSLTRVNLQCVKSYLFDLQFKIP